MSVSDVLFEAIEDMEEYQKDVFFTGQAVFYIEQAKLFMLAVRIYLDWPPQEAVKNFTKSISRCVYCGKADINEPMQPSQAYKAATGLDALVCNRCYSLEVILEDLRQKYRAGLGISGDDDNDQ